MRVAYVCADAGVPVFGRKGASVHVQGVLAAFLRAGAEVDLLAARTGGAVPPALAGVRVHALPRPPETGDPGERERAGMAANAELAAALFRLGPVDLVYERYSLWSHAAMEHDAPTVLEVNAPLPEEHAAHRGLVHRAEARATARRVLGAADVVAAVSTPVARWAAELGAAAVEVTPNGVDPERFAVLPARGDGPFTVGFLGTLKPWHGLDDLVRAFAILRQRRPDARLLVVGDGPGRAALASDLAARGLARAAELTGAVEPAQVPAQLARMDVAVAPYPADGPGYFSPLKVVEAMAAGLPVVASAIGDVPLVVRDGVTGVLVPPGEPAAIAAALDALARAPRVRERIGALARRDVLAHRTWDAIVTRLTARAVPPGVAA